MLANLKVAFITSGSPILTGRPLQNEQAEALSENNVDIFFYEIDRLKLSSLLPHIQKFRKFIKKNNIQLIHVHYGLFAWIPILSNVKLPVIISFMGSDLHGGAIHSMKSMIFYLINRISSFLIQPFPKAIIVKSDYLAKKIYLKRKLFIIPNGVNLNKFYPEKRTIHVEKESFPSRIFTILFLGEKTNPTKNFSLLKAALKKVSKKYKLISPYPCDPKEIPSHLNNSDLLVLSSTKEGSPNVVKEAMACNLPVVSTDVGDVKWLFGNLDGYFISSFSATDMADKIEQALRFVDLNKQTEGRNRILDLGLDHKSVAMKILEVYKNTLNSKL